MISLNARTPLIDCLPIYCASRPRGISPATLHGYRSAIHYLTHFLERDPTPTDLNDVTIRAAMLWMLEIGLSARSANNFCNSIRVLWVYLAKQRVVKAFPTVGHVVESQTVLPAN